LTGLLLAVSFPPAGQAQVAWFAFVPLIILARCSDPLQAWWWGWASGAVFWSLNLIWLLRLSQSGGYLPAVVTGWVLLSAYCAAYTGAFAMVVAGLSRRIVPSRVTSGTMAEISECGSAEADRKDAGTLWNVAWLVLVPLLWVGFEYLRATLFTGFSWNALGVSQFRNLAIIQVAEFGGVYAVSFVIMLMNTGVALTILKFVARFRGVPVPKHHLELMLAVAVCCTCLFWGARKTIRLEAENDVAWTRARLALIQPAVPQVQKWSQEHLDEIYSRLADLTRNVKSLEPDLVVWPETAVPYCLLSDTGTLAFVHALVEDVGPILVGSMEAEGMGDSLRWYNSSFLVGGNGEILGWYRKRHLVPFGEYIPLERAFPLLGRFAPLGFSCTPGTTSTVFVLAVGGEDSALAEERATDGSGTVPLRLRDSSAKDELQRAALPFSVLICFEDTISWLARDAVRNGARLLINQTNDAWFEGSAAAVQHMSHCVFRCVENRVVAARCANLGISCFIDWKGEIDATTLELLKQGAATATQWRVEEVHVPLNDRPPTFYTRFGDMPFALPCSLGAVAALLAVVMGRVRLSPT